MKDMQWLREYDSKLHTDITAIFGEESSPFYTDDDIDKLRELGQTGFYFNATDKIPPAVDLYLPETHRFAVMIVDGKATRSTTPINMNAYVSSLDMTPENGKHHIILYFKSVFVEFQGLFQLGKLNKHRAMGAQVIVDSHQTGYLRATTDFVQRFAGRKDIMQTRGDLNDAVKELDNFLRGEYPST